MSQAVADIPLCHLTKMVWGGTERLINSEWMWGGWELDCIWLKVWPTSVFESVPKFWIERAGNDSEITGPITRMQIICLTKLVSFIFFILETGVVSYLGSDHFRVVPFWGQVTWGSIIGSHHIKSWWKLSFILRRWATMEDNDNTYSELRKVGPHYLMHCWWMVCGLGRSKTEIATCH